MNNTIKRLLFHGSRLVKNHRFEISLKGVQKLAGNLHVPVLSGIPGERLYGMRRCNMNDLLTQLQFAFRLSSRTS